jgi:hypothetical protein
MLGNKHNIESGDYSFNVQGNTVNVTNGLSYSEVKEVALDTFQANFYKLANKAAEIAKQRAEEITTSYLEQLQIRDADAINSLKEPDMQYALLMAQKEYARSGDKDLSEMLVDILVERSRIKGRSLMQIVLNESLEVAPKLTTEQLDILSLVFILKYTKNYMINSLPSLQTYIESTIYPFLIQLTKEQSQYQHLEYTGCGAISIGERQLEEIFFVNYQGIFSKGFPLEKYNEILGDNKIPGNILISCLHDPKLYQFNALTVEDFNRLIDLPNLKQSQISDLQGLQHSNLMNHSEIKAFIIKICPEMDKLFETWGNSPMKNMTLTSVGIALGHANIRRKTSENFDLSIWIK